MAGNGHPADDRPVFEYRKRDPRHWERLGALFDGYGLPPWKGQTKAADAFLAALPGPIPVMRKLPFATMPGGYIVKETG